MNWLRRIVGLNPIVTGKRPHQSEDPRSLADRVRADIQRQQKEELRSRLFWEERARILVAFRNRVREYVENVNREIGHTAFHFFEGWSIDDHSYSEGGRFGIKFRGTVRFWTRGTLGQICAEFYFAGYLHVYVVDPDAVTQQAVQRYLWIKGSSLLLALF